MEPSNATILFGDDSQASVVSAIADGCDRLWLEPADLQAATGWALKPQGLCRGDACVPVARDGSWVDEQDRIDLIAFARYFGSVVVADRANAVWAFGPPSTGRLDSDSVMAPDFTLPDLDGELHSLSDLRGKKVFLHTWGSYCGCAFDLPLWQVVYAELRDAGFEMVSVALDIGGAAAVADKIRPTDPFERPDQLRRAMGWSVDDWAAQAPPEYLCLIDVEHLLAVRYEMPNVPMAVWIDEAGRMVRPPESAGYTDHFLAMEREALALDDGNVDALIANRHRYVDALRDWVANGERSEFALSPDEVRRRLQVPDEDDLLAATHVRVGRHLHRSGDVAEARKHFLEALRLSPDKWSYRRQEMMLDHELIGEVNGGADFWAAADLHATEFYNRPIDMPGIDNYAHGPA